MASKSANHRSLRKALVPYLLCLPTIVLVIVFLYGVINGLLQGFGLMPFLGMYDLTLDYWADVFQRSDLMNSVLFSLYIAAASSIVALLGGIVLSAALCAINQTRLMTLLDIQIPLMVAHILVVLFMVSLFAGSGLFPRLLFNLGLVDEIGQFPSIVGNPSGWGIIASYVWKEVPFIAFCTISIMGNVSGKFGEAASTLGASGVRGFFTVTLPLCRGALLKAFLVVFAFAFGAYEIPFLLEPTLPKALPVLAYNEFQNPDILNRCVAMALNGVIAVVTAVVAAVYFAILKREKRHS